LSPDNIGSDIAGGCRLSPDAAPDGASVRGAWAVRCLSLLIWAD